MTYATVPMKRVLSRNDGGVWGDEPTGYGDSIVFRSTDQGVDGQWLNVDPAWRSLTPTERAKGRLMAGDLLMTKSSGSPRHIGKTTLVSDDLAKSRPAYSNFMQRLRFRPTQIPRFYWYCLRSSFIRDQLNLISTTTTGLANLNASTIGGLEVPAPAREVQEEIVRFLDQRTARLDLLVEKQERLIETLAERRLVMIADAINEAATQPDSRGEGRPRVERLDRVTADVADCLHTSANEEPDGEYIVARTTSVRDGNFRPIGTFRVSKSTYDERIAKARPEPGDILLTREAPSGEACLVPGGLPICLGQRMVLVRPRADRLHAQLVVWNMYMPQVKRYLDVETSGSGVQNLTMPRIRRLPLVVPPLSRQRKLVAELTASTGQIDALSAKAGEMIDVLKERRQALISAAVTGKIDVRGLS